jgi:hypothetical protein
VPTISPLIADITHILKQPVSIGHSHDEPFSCHVRNSYTALASLAAVQLNPGIMYRVIAHSQTVDGSPESPSGPLSHVWVYLASYNENDKVAKVSTDYSCSSLIRAVTQISEAEYYGESERSPDCSKSVSCDAVESKCPGLLSASTA